MRPKEAVMETPETPMEPGTEEEPGGDEGGGDVGGEESEGDE